MKSSLLTHFSRNARNSFLILLLATIVSGFFAMPAGASERKEVKNDNKKHIVVFSLPRVTWELLGSANTPTIDSLIKRGSVAALSVRTLGPVTTPAQGYATLSAGNRAAAVDALKSTFVSPTEFYDGETGEKIFAEQRGKTTVKNPAGLGLGFERSLRANAKGLYNTKIGSFANALRDDGKSIAVFGNTDMCVSDSVECFERSVGYIASTSNGVIKFGDISRDILEPKGKSRSTIQMLDNQVVGEKAKTSIKNHDVTIVECSDLERIEQSRSDTKKEVSESDFKKALNKCDQLINSILPAVNLAKDQVYLLAPSAPKEQQQTTIFVAAGNSIPKGYTSSATTRRQGVVTLVDIAPTILAELDVALPKDMSDTLLDWQKSSDSITSREKRLVKINDQAIVRDRSIKPVTNFLIVAFIFSVLVAMIAFTRPKRWRKYAEFLALACAIYPTTTYLIQPAILSIEKSFGFIAVFAILSSSGALLAMWAAKKWNYPVVILAIASSSLFVQCFDIVFGGNLQFNSFFGYSPIVAGRFAGFGNQSFAIVAICSVVIVAMVKELTHDLSKDIQKKINLALLAFLVLVVIIDGAPYFGSDVGGVLAIIPTIFVVGIMLFEKRVNIKALFLASFVTVGVITTFALIDLARPVSKRTHLGRFAQSLKEGQAGIIIERKIFANLKILTGSVWAIVVLFSIIYLMFLVLSKKQYFQNVNSSFPGFKYLIVPGSVVAVLGMFLNDSGVAIPAMMFIFLTGVITVLALDSYSGRDISKADDKKVRSGSKGALKNT